MMIREVEACSGKGEGGKGERALRRDWGIHIFKSP
jgi:hypothetical protein